MKTHSLHINQLSKLEELVLWAKQHQPAKGDEIKVYTNLDSQNIGIQSILALLYLAVKQIFSSSESTEIADRATLENLASSNVAQKFETDYGIHLTLNPKEDEERSDWINLSMQNLERAYSDDEPDYSDVEVKEPNPDYNP